MIGKKTGGRKPGTPNKVTADARKAIAEFVDGNANRLQAWLDSVANGVPKIDAKGAAIPGEWIVEPNPERAFNMFQSVIEYHVPKQARTVIAGDPNAPIYGRVEIVAPKPSEDKHA